MRIYSVPPDMNEKEKVVGGLLTLTQLFWIIGGLGIGGVVFSILYPLIGGQLAVVFSLVVSTVGLPFAFYKKKELTLFQYISLKRKFKKGIHKLPNRQKGVEF